MRHTIDDFILSASKEGLYFYTGIGGFFGVLKSFFIDNGQNIILTAVLGFTGALFGGIAKLLIDRIAKRSARREALRQHERDHYESLKRKEQEELLLQREEELTKHGL